MSAIAQVKINWHGGDSSGEIINIVELGRTITSLDKVSIRYLVSMKN